MQTVKASTIYVLFMLILFCKSWYVVAPSRSYGTRRCIWCPRWQGQCVVGETMLSWPVGLYSGCRKVSRATKSILRWCRTPLQRETRTMVPSEHRNIWFVELTKADASTKTYIGLCSGLCFALVSFTIHVEQSLILATKKNMYCFARVALSLQFTCVDHLHPHHLAGASSPDGTPGSQIWQNCGQVTELQELLFNAQINIFLAARHGQTIQSMRPGRFRVARWGNGGGLCPFQRMVRRVAKTQGWLACENDGDILLTLSTVWSRGFWEPHLFWHEATHELNSPNTMFISARESIRLMVIEKIFQSVPLWGKGVQLELAQDRKPQPGLNAKAAVLFWKA